MHLETKIVNDSCLVIQKDQETNVSVCGSIKYLDTTPLILKGPEDFRLIKSKSPGQEIIYIHDRKWTLMEAREYLAVLLQSSKLLINTSILEIARYRIEREHDYSKVPMCEGYRHRNLVAMCDFNYDNCGRIELSDKCAYCPIGFRCPVCSCIDKENICYMHQAECIAALLISQMNKFQPQWVYQILIPDSWVKQFGYIVYTRVRSKRCALYNIFYTSDLVFNIKVTVNETECDLIDYLTLKHLLSFTPLKHRERGIVLEFNVDRNTLDDIKTSMPKNIIYHEEKVEVDEDSNTDLFDVRGISFGDIDSNANIINTKNKTLGNPKNIYTYSMLYCIRDYINSDTKNVLDVGCGRGTTSVYAYMCGAQHIDALDIAYKCCRETETMFNLSSKGYSNRVSIIEEDIFEFIYYKKISSDTCLYDVIIGNIHYDIQKDLLPKVSSILKDGGIYIAGGTPILIERALLDIDTDLELIDSRYFYNSVISIFQKRKESL